MTLTIEGKEINLDFATNYFYQFYKEDSGHDLVSDPYMVLMDLGSIELFKHIQSLIWAGYRSFLALTKAAKGEVSRDDVSFFVMSGNDETALALAYQLWSCRRGMTVDEFKEDIEKRKKALEEAGEEGKK